MLEQTFLFLAPVKVCSMCWAGKKKKFFYVKFARHLKAPLNMNYILSDDVFN